MILTASLSNLEVSRRLDEVADLLATHGAHERRVAVYRRGAGAVRLLPMPVTAILRSEGLDGLIRVPAIGEKMARTVRRLAVTGALPILQRLRGVDPG
jgi:DNA polymerase/3'-5' exonuclease PolX